MSHNLCDFPAPCSFSLSTSACHKNHFTRKSAEPIAVNSLPEEHQKLLLYRFKGGTVPVMICQHLKEIYLKRYLFPYNGVYFPEQQEHTRFVFAPNIKMWNWWSQQSISTMITRNSCRWRCAAWREECMLEKCAECPGSSALREVLDVTEKLNDVFYDSISYKQWVSTDRASLDTIVSNI